MSHVTNCVISSFVDDCKLLDSQILHVKVAHYHKKANKCVDTLLIKMNVLSFETSPLRVIDVFNFDFVGLYSNGLCLSTFDVVSLEWMSLYQQKI